MIYKNLILRQIIGVNLININNWFRQDKFGNN
jgi:hypothetical protein